MTDYQEAVQNPRLCFSDSELKHGIPVLDQLGLPKPITGAFATVYQLICNRQKYAARCFLRYHQDRERRYAEISRHLHENPLACMVDFQFLRQGILVRGHWYPILKMEWIDGQPLNTYLAKCLHNPDHIRSLAQRFVSLLADLRRCSIAHGDLQHGNILIANGNLRLIDYDGMYVPGLDGMASHELGHRNYQHPRRTEKHFGSYLDNFSAWVIYISLIAIAFEPTMWQRLRAGDEHLLFRREDFEDPKHSSAFPILNDLKQPSLSSVVSSLQVSLYMDPSQIPPLSTSAIAETIIVCSDCGQKNRIDVKAPHGPGRWRCTNCGAVISTEPSPPGPSWVFDHLPVPTIYIKASCGLERLSLMLFILIAPSVISFAAAGMIEIPLAVSGITGGISMLLLLFTLRYRTLPETVQKTSIISELASLRKQTNRIHGSIGRLKQEMENFRVQEHQKSSEIHLKQHQLTQKENEEIDGIDRQLNTTLARINSQRQALNQAESNDLAQRLKDVQNLHLSNQLSRHYIASATISGIGPELKKRLLASGIGTAADIRSIHIGSTGWGHYSREIAYIEVQGRGRIHIDGIGPKKVRALWSWRQSVESPYRRSMPQSLPASEESAIRSKYGAQRHSLSIQETDAKRTANQKSDAVRGIYRKEQDDLSTQLQTHREQLAKTCRDLEQRIAGQERDTSEKDWLIAKARRDLEAYRQVSFAAYIKHVLGV